MKYNREKVNLIILLSLALIIIPNLIISNQRDNKVSFDDKNTIENITPQPPRESSVYYEDTDGFARGVYVSGDYAYMGVGSWGLAVIDISDPTNPGVPVYENTTGYAYNVYVSGDYAYMGVGNTGLAVIDISNPTNPGTPVYEDTDGFAQCVYVSGDYAYVGDGNTGLAVIDISNPTNPGTPIYEDTDGFAYSVYVSGDYAYVGDGNTGLAVIDISDPTNPGMPVYEDTTGLACDIYVSGDYAYVAAGSSGLVVIDISDPTNPGMPVYEATTGSAYGVYVSGDYAYVGAGSSGLVIIDIFDPTNPGTPFYEATTDSAYGVYVSGDYAYMGVGNSGLAVIDISYAIDPRTPVYEATTGSAYGVYVSGDYAYVADYSSGLAVIDISDPTNPGTPVYEDTDGYAYNVYVSGDYAYVADYSSGLAVIDISDPTNPGTPVYEDTDGFAHGIYVSGDYAYMGVGSWGLAVINISNPTNPGTSVYEDTDGSAHDVYVSGDFAYVADYGSGLAIINISDPTDPGTPVYEDTDGSAYSVYVSGDFAYVADYGSGLAIINISDPTKPGTPVYQDTTSSAYGVYVSGDYAYMGVGSSGLAVIQVRRRYDIVDPIITILDPNTNNNLFGTTAPSFRVQIEDTYPGIDTMWYTIDGGDINTTFTTNESIDQSLWESKENGTVTIRFYANDTSGNINWEEITVHKDIEAPDITINHPDLDQEFGKIPPSYDLSIDEGNLDKIWYTLDGGTTNISTDCLVTHCLGQIDEAVWEEISQGSVQIRFYANDTLGNIGWKDVNIIKTIPGGAPFNTRDIIIIGLIVIAIAGVILFTALKIIKYRAKIIIKSPRSVGKFSIIPKGAKGYLELTREEDNNYNVILKPPTAIKVKSPIKSLIITDDVKLKRTLLNTEKIISQKKEVEDKKKRKSIDNLKRMGNSLYSDFIPKGIQDKLKSYDFRTLELGLDSNLLQFPWELFHDGEEFLGFKYSIGRYIIVKDLKLEIPYRDRGLKKGISFLIIGDPAPEIDGKKLKLRGAWDEANQLNDKLSKIENVNTTLLLEEEADSYRVEEELKKDYDFIHYCGHAYFDIKDPNKNGLLLNDGLFRASSIANVLNREKPPILAFINACKSSKEHTWTDIKYENQVSGLASSFLLNGINYIGSLWSIHDNVAVKTAESFYFEVLNNVSIGESLRRAKIFVHESFKGKQLGWASYILYGDPTYTLEKKE